MRTASYTTPAQRVWLSSGGGPAGHSKACFVRLAIEKASCTAARGRLDSFACFPVSGHLLAWQRCDTLSQYLPHIALTAWWPTSCRSQSAHFAGHFSWYQGSPALRVPPLACAANFCLDVTPRHCRM
jgi:hypothetical protein